MSDLRRCHCNAIAQRGKATCRRCESKNISKGKTPMNTKPSIVITGPQGCGKSRNAHRLSHAFGLKRVIDEGAELRPRRIPQTGALVLTTRSEQELREAGLPPGVRVIPFAEAMLELEIRR